MANNTTKNTDVDLTQLSNEQLLAMLKDKEAEAEKVYAELETASKINEELQTKLEDKNAIKVEAKVTRFIYNKEQYRFTSEKFTMPNSKSIEEPSLIIASEAVKNKELLKELIEKKSGLIVKE